MECGKLLGYYTKVLDTTHRGREQYIRKVIQRMTLDELEVELDRMEQKACQEVPITQARRGRNEFTKSIFSNPPSSHQISLCQL